MQLTSTSYQNNSPIPSKYANTGAGGQNVSPQFSWSGVPAETKSFILTIIDIHPIASNWVHWMLINIPAGTTSLAENCSAASKIPASARELMNSFGKKGYGGPQPPRGSGDHAYVATLYALNVDSITLPGSVSEKDLVQAIKAHVLDKAKLTGYFSR